MADVDAFLEHHGIKGMKWGVRKRVSTSRTAKAHPDYKEARDIRRKPHAHLSNRELKIANERANLEQNFLRLNPTKVQRGKRQAEAALALIGLTTGPAVARAFINSPAGKATTQMGKNLAGKFLDGIGNKVVKIKF